MIMGIILSPYESIRAIGTLITQIKLAYLKRPRRAVYDINPNRASKTPIIPPIPIDFTHLLSQITD
jgi:hypothetical protein